MINLDIYFNNKFVNKNGFNIADLSVKFGDWCLTPVRYLFDGNKVFFAKFNSSDVVDHRKEYVTLDMPLEYPQLRKKNLRLVASIILIIPGFIIGSAFKGLGYLSHSVRERHRLTIKHYTPRDCIIGSKENGLDLSSIEKELGIWMSENFLNQPTKNIIIYAQDELNFNEESNLICLEAQKIILIGARIVYEASSEDLKDESLDGNNEKQFAHTHKSTFVKQQKVENQESLDSALKLVLDEPIYPISYSKKFKKFKEKKKAFLMKPLSNLLRAKAQDPEKRVYILNY